MGRSREPLTRTPGNRPERALPAYAPPEWEAEVNALCEDMSDVTIENITSPELFRPAQKQRILDLVDEYASHAHIHCMLQFMGYKYSELQPTDSEEPEYTTERFVGEAWAQAGERIAVMMEAHRHRPSEFADTRSAESEGSMTRSLVGIT